MRKYFITGLVTLLPIAFTVMIIVFMVNLLTNPFIGFTEGFIQETLGFDSGILFLSKEQITRLIAQMIILMMLGVATIMLGVLARWFFINYLIKLGEYVVHQIPLVNKIYKACKDIIETLFGSTHQAFRQVVIVPFPNPGVYSLGFVTRSAPDRCIEITGKDLVSVFVPTTPNPTSGYLMMFKREDVIHTEMDVEDAIKFVISCGVIHPDTPETLQDHVEQFRPKYPRATE